MSGDPKSLSSFQFDDSTSKNQLDNHILQSYGGTSEEGFLADDRDHQSLLDKPQSLADTVYEAICKDIEEKPTSKGMTAFRDRIFEDCRPACIKVRDARMSINGVTALTRMMASMSVTTLDLGQNNLGDEGVSVLASYTLQQHPILRVLCLASNGIGFNGMESLLSLLPFIKRLDVSNIPGSPIKNHIRGACLGLLLKTLKTQNTLEMLNLSNNGIGQEQASIDSRKGKNSAISSSQASNNLSNLSYHDAISSSHILSFFGSLLSNNADTCHLQHLILDRNHLSTSGATFIITALTNNACLRVLSLGNNNITEDIAPALDQMLRSNRTLSTLILRDNPIQNGLSRCLHALSSNTSLSVLDLTNCDLDDTCAFALAQLLAVNKSVTRLCLGQNRISMKGGYALATALKYNQVLDYLDQSGNPLKLETGIALAESLRYNTSLTYLDISSCKFNDQVVLSIVESILHNNEQQLETLKLKGNHLRQSSTAIALLNLLSRKPHVICLDLTDTQLEYARLRKCWELCLHNKKLKTNNIITRLDSDISLLRSEQTRLRRSEATLSLYKQSVDKTEQLIQETQYERQTFFLSQGVKREELRLVVQRELDLVAQASSKQNSKRSEQLRVESAFNTHLQDLHGLLQQEEEKRKKLEKELVYARRGLEDAIQQHPAKLDTLKKVLETTKEEKQSYAQHLAWTKKELVRQKEAYETGQPIPEIVQQVRALLLQQQMLETTLKKDIEAAKQV